MKNKANGLINEKSPYLLQHAYNPVDWLPWSDETLARAVSENKPIFLSVGYSTCHWCHVMARESFENQQVAALLNRWFISVKVDREERPDIDQLYMNAVRLLTGGGGWPLSVFLLPDGRPFYGGTYFPPERVGDRPGFMEILGAVYQTWREKKSDLNATADAVMNALKRPDEEVGSGDVDEELGRKAYEQLGSTFDPQYGGFGPAPKFPSPGNLNFLLDHWFRSTEQQALDMVATTLRAMAGGGMYDHLGGGFHRYSVDAKWFLPHFEKMIYDQCQLISTYLDGYLAAGDEEFARIARQTIDYLLRDLRHPGGAFYSAEDADSPEPASPDKKSEGAFYVWSEEEIVKVIGKRGANIFCYAHGVEFDGNVAHDPFDEFKGKNVIARIHDTGRIAEHLRLEPGEVDSALDEAKEALYRQRLTRPRPHLDDKVITAWNGLAIHALAKSAAVLRDDELLHAAHGAADFIREHLYDPVEKTLLRRYREGSVGVAGQLDDYAYLIGGLLELYGVSGKVDLLDWLLELAAIQDRLFWDEHRYGYFTVSHDSELLLRLKGDHDGAEPAPNSTALSNLWKLSVITGKKEWRERAEQLLRYFSPTLNKYPTMLLQMLTAHRQLRGNYSLLVIAGKREAADTRAMLGSAYSVFRPDLIVLLADGGENQERLSGFHPFIAEMKPTHGRATAYLCHDYTCREPITDPEQLRNGVREAGRK